MEEIDQRGPPLLTAVSSSARQLFQLLRCISFASKAEVRISKDGLRFAVEESRVMQGLVFLNNSLFTAYIYSPPSSNESEEQAEPPTFQISLSSLLETLQIFGINDSKDRSYNRDSAYGSTTGSFSGASSIAAFENRALGMTGMCRLSYHAPGDPLCIILEEAGVTTTCELVTYEPEIKDEIPFQSDALTLKIIMRANLLHDAVVELSSTSPTRLIIVASPTAPHFALSSCGPFGSATVEFNNNSDLLDVFHVPQRTVNTYKYSLIKGASRAMAMASKVSIREDEQGVLSLQFLVGVDGGGATFVDFRFVPCELEEGEGEGEGEGGEDGEDGGDGGEEEDEDEDEDEGEGEVDHDTEE